MKALLDRLGVAHLEGTAQLQPKLEEIQMEYLRSIWEVTDPVRRMEMQDDLKELEAAIEYLASQPKLKYSQPISVANTEENFEDLKGEVEKEQKRLEADGYSDAVSECDKGLELLQSGDIEQAIVVLTRAAECEDYAAMYNLGVIYYSDEYGKRDIGKALHWLHKTADVGDPISMSIIGSCYANGDGVVQDYQKANEWYRKGAEIGYPECQYNLAVNYENGYGIEQDYEKACEWYQKAANADYVYAVENLAGMYWNGMGVTQNAKKAIELFEKAVDLGCVSAQHTLGTILLNQGELSRGIELVEKAAQVGYIPALGTIAFVYLRGIGGVKKDTSKALYYLRPAVEEEEPEAMAVFSMMLKDGDGVYKDEKLARQLAFKAASMGNQRAIAMLANWTR